MIDEASVIITDESTSYEDFSALFDTHRFIQMKQRNDQNFNKIRT